MADDAGTAVPAGFWATDEVGAVPVAFWMVEEAGKPAPAAF